MAAMACDVTETGTLVARGTSKARNLTAGALSSQRAIVDVLLGVHAALTELAPDGASTATRLAAMVDPLMIKLRKRTHMYSARVAPC